MLANIVGFDHAGAHKLAGFGFPKFCPMPRPNSETFGYVGRMVGLVSTMIFAYWMFMWVADANEFTERKRNFTPQQMYDHHLLIIVMALLVFKYGSMDKTFSLITALGILGGTLAFSFIAEMPAMHGSLDNATPALKVLFPAVGLVVLMLLVLAGVGSAYCSGSKSKWGYVANGAFKILAPIALVMFVLFMGKVAVDRQNAEREEGLAEDPVRNNLPPAASFHPHHWQIGLLIALATPFPQYQFRFLQGVGLGVFVHGVASYGPASLIETR